MNADKALKNLTIDIKYRDIPMHWSYRCITQIFI